MSKFVSIGSRLREEREKTGLNQEDFAALGGVGRKTQFNYESGERSPDGAYLALLAGTVDVQYILTGERTAAPTLTAQQECAGYTVDILNKEEQALLDNYRNTPETGKKIVEATVLAAAQPGRKKA